MTIEPFESRNRMLQDLAGLKQELDKMLAGYSEIFSAELKPEVATTV